MRERMGVSYGFSPEFQTKWGLSRRSPSAAEADADFIALTARLKSGPSQEPPASPSSVPGAQRFPGGRSAETSPPGALARRDSRRRAGAQDRAPALPDRTTHKKTRGAPKLANDRATRSPRPLRGGSTTTRSGLLRV